MAKKLGDYLNTIPYKNWSLGLAFVNLLLIAAVFLLRGRIPPVVPLFYGKPYGAEQLAPQIFLALPPAVAFLFCVANTGFNYALNDEFLKKVLVAGMAAATILSFVTVSKIFFLVGVI